jgi:hypothetical protein
MSSGIIERTVFKNIFDNFNSNGKIFLTIYSFISLFNLSTITPIQTYLFQKIGFSNTLFLISILILLSVPLLKNLNIKV